MTLRTMPSSSSTRRPRGLCPPKLHSSCSNQHSCCPSKRQRDPNSTSSQTSIKSHAALVSPTASLPLSLFKRHRSAATKQPRMSQFRGPGPPFPNIKSLPVLSSSSASSLLTSPSPSSSSLSSLSSSSSSSLSLSITSPSFTASTPAPKYNSRHISKKLPVQLPDEVLVSIFRFIDHAAKLARLRTVCKQWCNVIDNTPDVWRMISFKNADFSQKVTRSHSTLMLGTRPGERAVTIAARSGNEWARFLKKIIFDRHTLKAVTTPQPIATLLVSGERPVDARPFPPWTGNVPDSEGTWVAIHAARRGIDGSGATEENNLNGEAAVGVHGGSIEGSEARGMLRERDGAKLPFGAMVGMIHVQDAFQATGGDNNSNAPRWIWRIDRAVRLKKPIRCAGFLGLWSVSGFLTDLFVNAMHKQ